MCVVGNFPSEAIIFSHVFIGFLSFKLIMAEIGEHEKNRKRLCVVCSRLANRKKPLSMADINAIKEYVDNDFNPDNPDYPCALCNDCYLLLNKKRNGHNVVIKIEQRYKSEDTPKFIL